MGFFSFLKGSTKSLDKVVDAGISGLDKLVYTEEEKADYNRKLQELHLEFIKITATESTAQSISRRLICLPVVYIWLLMVVLSVALDLAGIPAVAVGDAVDSMSTPSLAAIGFYVGRHIMGNR